MIKEIEEEVFEFLRSKEAKVLVIKGPWGTGKTFVWSKWLKQASRAADGVALQQYSYVSLFGCNSLDEFKAQIFEQMIPTSIIGDEVSVQSVSRNLNAVVEKKNWRVIQSIFGKLNKIGKVLENVPFIKNYTIDIWRMGWLITRDALICIDDLERIGDGLRIKDVYGLVSLLKEQKKCKVVLILNDENITGENKADYEEYREKVVDMELHYKPDARDLVKLVFSESYPHYEVIKKSIVSTGINNVRTIQKIKSYLDKIEDLLKDVEEEYYRNAINSIALFTVLNFSRPKDWPTLDEVLSTDMQQFAMVEYMARKEPGEGQNFDREWVNKFTVLKNNYEWHGADEIDQIFGDYVRKGYINGELLAGLIAKAAEDSRKIKLKNEASQLHSKVGEILWEGFENNIEDIISSMKSSLEKSVQIHPSIEHLNQYVGILRRLNQNTAAASLINQYIEWAKQKDSRFLRLFDVNTHFSGPLDAELSRLIQSAYEQLHTDEIEQIVNTQNRFERIKEAAKRCPEYRLTEGDYEILSHFEEADFQAFLRNTDAPREARLFMKIFLAPDPIIGQCVAEHNNIQAKLIAMVHSIAAESELNAFRVNEYLKLIDDLNATRRNA